MTVAYSAIEDISDRKSSNLFETVNIKLDCPYRLNQKDWDLNLFPLQKQEKNWDNIFPAEWPIHAHSELC